MVALVVPDCDDLRSHLLTMHHDSPLAGYLGLYRMMRALAKCYWWKVIMNFDNMYMLVRCVRLLKCQLRSRRGCYSHWVFWTTCLKSVQWITSRTCL